MNHISRIKMTPKLTTASLLALIFSASLITTGCTSAKEDSQASASTPIVKQLSEPSLAYLSSATVASQGDSEAWLTVAKSNYDAKRYARALRAANEALSRDDENIEARQIAMLSAVKVMGSNIAAYRDDALMDSSDKATFKQTLTNVTTLINTPN